jgi:hypothetical protein
MTGEKDIERLLASMNPEIMEGEFVFCTVQIPLCSEFVERLNPLSVFREPEGLSILVPKDKADSFGLVYSSVFRGITLKVHSSLEAVGFTAAIAAKLSGRGISANVIAAFYHDHVFVPSERIGDAMSALHELSKKGIQIATK